MAVVVDIEKDFGSFKLQVSFGQEREPTAFWGLPAAAKV